MPNPQVYEAGSPFSRAVRDYSDAQGRYAGEEWKRYLGVLNGARLQAQGPGIGATRGLLPRPGDEDILRSNAANAYAASLTDENRMRAQADRDMAAHNEQVDAAERGRQTAERALAIANDPNTSQFGRPIVGGNGSYATSREPIQPGNPQAIAAQMAPGLIAPPPPPKPVTFEKPEAVMVTGPDGKQKRVFARAGSDGLMYGMDRKPIPAEAIAPEAPPPGVSDQGVELAARNYLTTGVMPPLGQGDKTTRQRILDKAAEMGGEGANIAGNKATYKADSGSLATLQKQRDTIGAFEETAGKNIDIFLDTAGKIVDSGSPLLNTPLRAATGKLLGSPDQAKYDAARQVAINEIAKITSNPNLTGQLSDSARHEVEAFNPSGATLAQTVAVMRLLKQDMANRITSLDDAVKNVKGRLAGSKSDDAGGGAGKKIVRYDMDGKPIK